MITQNELKEVLEYNQDTGVFTWLINFHEFKAYKIKVGDVAGGLNNRGYNQIMINGKSYQAHRLAWLYVYGEFPKKMIDHINGIRDDNRIENLRDVSHRENNQNNTCHRNGKLVGCYFNKPAKKWKAQIRFNGRRIFLGYYDTEQQAHECYLKFLEENGDKNNIGGIES